MPASTAIPILSFLVSSLLPTSTARPGTPGSYFEPKHTLVTIEILRQATSPHPSGIPGRTIWDLLLNKLWGIDSLDALHVYFETLSLLLQKSPQEQAHSSVDDPTENRILLSRTSPLGTFIRRVQLEFSRLQFHDGVELWRNFVSYRAPTLQQWKRRNPTASSRSLDVNLQDIDSPNADSLVRLVYGGRKDLERRDGMKASTDDIEKLLEHQISQMQRTHRYSMRSSVNLC